MNIRVDELKPANGTHCIWMDAGVVGYKLCDRDYQCEECPFDLVMRQPIPKTEHRLPVPLNQAEEARVSDQTPREQLERHLDSFFVPLEAIPFPADRMFHKGRMWVQRLEEGESSIGIDHLGACILDSLITMVLPQPGAHLTENTPFCWLIHPEGTVTMHAPLSGTVTSANTLLVQHPEVMLTDPYGGGWILRIRADEPDFRSKDFLTREQLGQDFRRQLDAFRCQVVDRFRSSVAVGPTLPDGGVAIETLAELVGRKSFFQIIGRIFRP